MTSRILNEIEAETRILLSDLGKLRKDLDLMDMQITRLRNLLSELKKEEWLNK